MTEPADLIVIGAGPAGLAAASLASKHNLSVLLLDEQAAPGGQIYRNIEHNITHESETCAILGAEYAYGAALAETCRASDVTYTPGATVWRIDPDGSVAYSVNGAAHTAKGRRIILATGALERPVPIPGWTLPGVMTAGAAQTLLKASAMLPSGRVVVAGTGPLAMLVTLQLIDAGADIAALLETTRKRDYFSNAMLLPGAMAGQDYLRRGMAMRRAIRASGVPIYGGVTELEARGDGQVSSVRGRSGGERLTFEIDTLLVHDGVVPNIQATRQVGCEHEWYEPQRYWRPVRDSWGTTSIDTITVAGDGAGISGARAAEYLGQLAALDAACRLDKISMADRDSAARPIRSAMQPHTAIRPLLDGVFTPSFTTPHGDDTIVCRCEEVTAGEIRTAVAQGVMGPNQIKSFTRCGMGPCQGRNCGLTVAELIADVQGVPVSDVGYFRLRPPIKPVTLGELAAMDLSETDS
ncbi:MAG: FAD/NAD(P)-dependent oxidoreductase [Alphaproteobacteria bacterium]|jgi:NADPH-dependent 2,4-dienoyl-CoA reductase/sulfur reductase-like enzyme